MEAVRAYIWFLCRNDIPMSVEVLLYPDCCYTKDVEIEIGAAAESGSSSPIQQPATPPDHLLIEQWIVQVLPKRCVNIKGKGRGELYQRGGSIIFF